MHRCNAGWKGTAKALRGIRQICKLAPGCLDDGDMVVVGFRVYKLFKWLSQSYSYFKKPAAISTYFYSNVPLSKWNLVGAMTF